MPKKVKNSVPKYFYKQPRSQAWSVRLVPPKHVQHAVKEREFRRSTGLSDLKAAYPVGMTMVAQKLREWEQLAAALKASEATSVVLSDEIMEHICSMRFYSWMKTDDGERLTGLSDGDLLEIEDFCRLTDTSMRAVLAQGPGSSNWPDVVGAVLEWSEDLGYRLNPKDALFPFLVRRFAQVEKRANEGILGRNQGDDVVTPPAPGGASVTLSSIIDDFAAYKSPSNGEKQVSTVLNVWKLFIEHVGDIRFDAVRPGHIFDFMAARITAKDKPWSASRAKGFGKRTLREIFGLARTKGWMSTPNPIDGLEAFPSLSKDEELARKQPRFPFTTEQLNTLFASPWYDPGERKRFTGKMRSDLGARYWVPLIGLFHGNRVREAVQLVASDFSVKGGVLALTFRTEIDDEMSNAEAAVAALRSLKNAATQRTVPVHPLLLKLGFEEFLEGRRKKDGKSALLFPSSLPNAGGKSPKLGRAYEQSFLRFVRESLGYGHGYGNHSFRHQLEDRVRNSQVVSGHWPAGMSSRYTGRARVRPVDRDVLVEEGSERLYGDGYLPDQMLPYIARLSFDDLALPMPYADWLSPLATE